MTSITTTPYQPTEATSNTSQLLNPCTDSHQIISGQIEGQILNKNILILQPIDSGSFGSVY
jgi:hypothetical protein